MKYRILLLAVLACAILAAAMGGTLAGYTAETAYSVSIQPEATSTPEPDKTPKTAADIQAAEDAAQQDETQAEPEETPAATDAAPAETDTAADIAPTQTSDKEA